MDVIQTLFNGVAVGSIIALGAVGLTLSMGILRLSNFAHGDFLTVGAYLTWLVNRSGVNIWLSMVVAVIGTIVLMLLGEQLLWKPMRDQRASDTTLIIISIGLALFLRNGILLIWGSANQNYDLPLVEALDIGGVRIAYFRVLVVILTVIAIVALHFILQNTKIGKGMRAVADNIDLARVSGINVEQVILFTWILTAVLTAFGGALYGLITVVRPNMGWFLILPMFAGVTLGGIGNPYGAIAGGLVIGIIQEMSVSVVGAEYKLGIALLVMIAVLLFRPQGIFGK
ncbi:MAG: branched-chain amino acid ABC transporter permease [Cyanobacterium sp. T60_A2020_053]|nr:branched-chain amino acid ABC transporter permease [Cyanobacterium sp. T60_A2020_053]